jgi:hypothetical protein
MSPRRRKRPEQDPELPEFDGLVICTGHDRHRPLRIAGFTCEAVQGGGSAVSFSQTSRWDVVADARPDTLTLRFRCKLCRRDVRLTEANATAAVEALRAAAAGSSGPVTVDVSLLPC